MLPACVPGEVRGAAAHRLDVPPEERICQADGGRSCFHTLASTFSPRNCSAVFPTATGTCPPPQGLWCSGFGIPVAEIGNWPNCAKFQVCVVVTSRWLRSHRADWRSYVARARSCVLAVCRTVHTTRPKCTSSAANCGFVAAVRFRGHGSRTHLRGGHRWPSERGQQHRLLVCFFADGRSDAELFCLRHAGDYPSGRCSRGWFPLRTARATQTRPNG